ncbi:MAG: Thioesterase-like superfamily protein, partial [Acidimicrobiales bacterium]|nr:Thioesterase-like superfamily protein [Acidimicrobiales bacterium]
TTINADVNVQVLRPPVGEWVAVVGDTRFSHTTGLGISVAELHVRDGVCAIGTTSQLLQLR